MFSPGTIRRINGQHRLLELIHEYELYTLLGRLERDHGVGYVRDEEVLYELSSEGSIPAEVSEMLIAYLEDDIGSYDPAADPGEHEDYKADILEQYPELEV